MHHCIKLMLSSTLQSDIIAFNNGNICIYFEFNHIDKLNTSYGCH